MVLRLIPLVILLAVSSAAVAQDVRPVGADTVRALYQALEYDAAEATALRSLEDQEFASVDELVNLHFMLGLLRFIRSDSVAARSDFETVLSLNEAYAPDPVLVSPRATAFFERVRADYRAAIGPSAPAVRYVMVEDVRPAAALRSAIAPGWGQWYRGDRSTGGLLAGAWTATAGTALVLHLHADVQGGTRTVRDVATIGAGVVWLSSYLDALLTEGDTRGGIRVGPTVENDQRGVRAVYRF